MKPFHQTRLILTAVLLYFIGRTPFTAALAAGRSNFVVRVTGLTVGFLVGRMDLVSAVVLETLRVGVQIGGGWRVSLHPSLTK